MAANYFYYPDAVTPTITLTFDHGHLLSDSDMTVGFNQITGKAKGGTRYASSFGANTKELRFTAIIDVSSETATDRADVITLLDTLLGASYGFIWRDEEAVDRTVKIVDGSVSFAMISGNQCKFTCTLEVQE